MMKITATAATPYSAVLLLEVDVDVTVVVLTLADPETVAVETDTLVVVEADTTVVVDVLVLVLGGGTFCSVRARTSPGVVPGHVETASRSHTPTSNIMYSWPLTDAPNETPSSIGAPM